MTDSKKVIADYISPGFKCNPGFYPVLTAFAFSWIEGLDEEQTAAMARKVMGDEENNIFYTAEMLEYDQWNVVANWAKIVEEDKLFINRHHKLDETTRDRAFQIMAVLEEEGVLHQNYYRPPEQIAESTRVVTEHMKKIKAHGEMPYVMTTKAIMLPASLNNNTPEVLEYVAAHLKQFDRKENELYKKFQESGFSNPESVLDQKTTLQFVALHSPLDKIGAPNDDPDAGWYLPERYLVFALSPYSTECIGDTDSYERTLEFMENMETSFILPALEHDKRALELQESSLTHYSKWRNQGVTLTVPFSEKILDISQEQNPHLMRRMFSSTPN